MYVHVNVLVLTATKVKNPDDTPHILPNPIQSLQPVLEVESLVQFGNPVRYGVIKAIQESPNSKEKFAEIETVSHKVDMLICLLAYFR